MFENTVGITRILFLLRRAVQFTFWADAVMLVVSVESEESVQVARDYVAKMAELGRDLADLPMLLVGTNGTHSVRTRTCPHLPRPCPLLSFPILPTPE